MLTSKADLSLVRPYARLTRGRLGRTPTCWCRAEKDPPEAHVQGGSKEASLAFKCPGCHQC